MLQGHFTQLITMKTRCQCQCQCCLKQRRLDSPAKRLQWGRRSDRRRQSVPSTCSRHREGAVTECRAARWRHDQRRRCSRPETPTDLDVAADFWSVSARYCGAVPLRQRYVKAECHNMPLPGCRSIVPALRIIFNRVSIFPNFEHLLWACLTDTWTERTYM